MSPAAKPARRPEGSSTPSLEVVFEKLLLDIVAGRHPAGANLPSERDLALSLGISRPTLREALRRLGEWRLVEPRRGSGVVVRDRREWSLAVLPTYLRVATTTLPPSETGRLIADLLEVRKSFFADVLSVVSRRLTPESIAPAREAVKRAWAARGDVAAFVRHDFEILRALVEAAHFLPALWLLNDLSSVYLRVAGSLTGAASVPDDYRSSWDRVFTALEDGDAESASSRLLRYLEAHDRRLLGVLGIRKERS